MNTHSCSNITSGKRNPGGAGWESKPPTGSPPTMRLVAALEGGPEAQRPVLVERQSLAPEDAQDEVQDDQHDDDRRKPDQDRRDGREEQDQADPEEEGLEAVDVLLTVRRLLAGATSVDLLAGDTEVKPAVLDVHLHGSVSFVRTCMREEGLCFSLDNVRSRPLPK